MKKLSTLCISLILLLVACTPGLANMRSTLILDAGYGLIWQDRDYIPYCIVSEGDCTEQVGYVDGDTSSRVYRYKDYSEYEWLAWVQDDGAVYLLKERNVVTIPSGLDPSFASERI